MKTIFIAIMLIASPLYAYEEYIAVDNMETGDMYDVYYDREMGTAEVYDLHTGEKDYDYDTPEGIYREIGIDYEE